MIEFLHHSLYWCVLQVSFLASVGLVASIVVAKRRPAAACSIICATVVVNALLTASAVIPVHCLFALDGRNEPASVASDKKSTLSHALGAPIREPRTAVGASTTTVDLMQIASMVRAIASNVDLPDQRHRSTMTIAAWCFLATALIGIAHKRGQDSLFLHRLCGQALANNLGFAISSVSACN